VSTSFAPDEFRRGGDVTQIEFYAHQQQRGFQSGPGADLRHGATAADRMLKFGPALLQQTASGMHGACGRVGQ